MLLIVLIDPPPNHIVKSYQRGRMFLGLPFPVYNWSREDGFTVMGQVKYVASFEIMLATYSPPPGEVEGWVTEEPAGSRCPPGSFNLLFMVIVSVGRNYQMITVRSVLFMQLFCAALIPEPFASLMFYTVSNTTSEQ